MNARGDRKGAGYKQALDIALKMLSVRQRSEKEILERLRSKGFDSEIALEIMGDLQGKGLIDDLSLAQNIVVRGQESDKGLTRIYADIRKRGITRRTAEEALGDYYDPEKASESIDKLARESVDSLKGLPPDKKDIEALVRRLSRRGFPPSKSREALLRRIEGSPNCRTSFP